MTALRPVSSLLTPAALVDVPVVRRNVARMAERARRLGVSLRPHVKTHKCVEAARLQAAAGCEGITVSTFAEARLFAAAGFRDITYAVPLAPDRALEAAELAGMTDHFHVVVDHAVAVDALEHAARRRGRTLSAFLKVDCGYHRAGVDPRGEGAASLARRLADSTHVDFQGLLTHGGHAYGGSTLDEVRAIAAQERDVLVELAGRLRQSGVEIRTVSVGSTPTIAVVDHLDGVNEIRPGNYVFHDAFQATLGTCAWDDTAFTVLATIVGSYPERGALVIDAGALALSKDPGARQVDADAGFGVLQSVDRTATYAGARIHALSQEHGHVRVEGEFPSGVFDVGRKVQVIANHSCLAAALFDRYHAVAGGQVEGEWRPVRGW